MPLLFTIAVLAWARATNKPWSELGLAPPSSWPRAIVGGVLLGVGLKLLMRAIVLPLLGAGPFSRTYHYVVGNAAALPFLVLSMVLFAGFGEEVLFRGFVFERFGRWWGRGRLATVATVVASAVLFALAHVYGQGRYTVFQATVMGLLWGAIYARTRSLWMLMVTHATFDLFAIAIIYLGLEERVAHLLF